MHIHIRIIEIILQSIQYRNKELLLDLIKAELISGSGYLTQLAIIVSPKKYHSIHKLFSRVRFDYVAIQIEIPSTLSFEATNSKPRVTKRVLGKVGNRSTLLYL